MTLVVAAAENGVIGRAGALPWRLSADLRRFKRLTMGKPVIMGRRTWESLGKALPGRHHIIVTRRADYRVERGAADPPISVVHDFAAALELAAGTGAAATGVMVIGGAEIYALALPFASVVELTRVHARPDGDTVLPEFSADEWQEVARETHPADERNEHAMTFVTLRRRAAALPASALPLPPAPPATAALALFATAVLALLASAALATPPRSATTVQPRVVTEPVKHDSDDPAIWIDRRDPARSLVLGTDKDADGALYVFGLDGKIRGELVIRGLARPNNVDVAYDVMVGGRRIDVAIVAERFAHRLRVFSLPDLRPVDGGGIPVFEGERARDVMGVAAYTRPVDGALFAIVSRSDQFAPRSGYLHQYRLVDDGSGTLRGLKTRAFGEWSGNKEIEALSVDALRGVVFASDETFGLRKYSADPMVEDADDELAQFGLTGFARDHEGSAVFRRGNERPLLFVSDQQAGELRVFELEGPLEAPHRHALVGRIKYAARETDGIELTTQALPGFPGGLLVAMSTDRRFHFYALDELLRAMTAAEP